MKVGTYVTDKSDSSRYHKSVYCVTGESFDRTIVQRVGDLVNGRLDTSGGKGVTHRKTSNLVEWRS